MDIRIVNSCNNNCLYCLEQSYRKKAPFVDTEMLYKKIVKTANDSCIVFYGGNPLLHPDLESLLSHCKELWFSSIGILTNTFGLSKEKLTHLKELWLTSIGAYFNTFDKVKHERICGGGIEYKELLANLELLSLSGIHTKIIIHINKQNLESIASDIYVLHKKYGFKHFEFINYFPFDRPYDLHRETLEYDLAQNARAIYSLFHIIEKLKLRAEFIKFPKKFFWKYTAWYNYENGIKKQVWREDLERIETENPPSCFIQKRCTHCFLQDYCKAYE